MRAPAEGPGKEHPLCPAHASWIALRPRRVGVTYTSRPSAAFRRVAAVPPRPLLPGLACLRRQYVEVPLLGTPDVGSHDAHIRRVLE